MTAANDSGIAIHLPKPYPLQLEIIRSKAKRKVIAAGRRAGKTRLASIAAINNPYTIGGLLQGKKTLLLSASQDQADIFWECITTWLAPLTGRYYKNENKRIVEFNSGSIKVKTGSDPSAVKGFDADQLVLDECALLDPNIWYEATAPILADRDGEAMFISTPRRRNWFYTLYQRAISDTTGRWQAWNFASTANPHLSKTALDELSADMTEETYRQEILAEFLEGSGQVFRKIREAAILQERTLYKGRFVAGIDLGQRRDATVIAIMDCDTHELVYLDRFVGVEWTLQRERIKAIYAAWQPLMMVCEINSVGSVIFEDLARAGLPVEAFSTTASSKPPLIESLALAFERNEIRIIDSPILIGELESYERIVSATTGRSQYSAPSGLHDDCVIALALSWYGLLRGNTPVIFFVENRQQPQQNVVFIEDEPAPPPTLENDPVWAMLQAREREQDQEDLDDYLTRRY